MLKKLSSSSSLRSAAAVVGSNTIPSSNHHHHHSTTTHNNNKNNLLNYKTFIASMVHHKQASTTTVSTSSVDHTTTSSSNNNSEKSSNRRFNLTSSPTGKNCTTKKYIELNQTTATTTLNKPNSAINTKLTTSVKNFIRNSAVLEPPQEEQEERDYFKKGKKQKNPDIPSLTLKYHEPLFGTDSMEKVMLETEHSTQVHEGIVQILEKLEPFRYIDLTKYLLFLNQVQYIPDIISLASKKGNIISHYSFAKELAYQLERKGKHIKRHPSEYPRVDTKVILNRCAKCLDMMISSGYKAVQTTNTDIFIDILCFRIKMFQHTNDVKGLKKLFEHQLKPLTSRFLTHPVVLCKLYNGLSQVLIEMNELNYLYEQVYAKNMTNHFNIVKLVKRGISGTPLFVTLSQLLSKSNIAHTNIASKMCLLGGEYLELAKKENDQAFLKKLGGTIARLYGDLFDVDKNNLLPLENYFSLYLNFISYYWNLHSEVLEKKFLKYISIRFLYLYARLVHDSAYDVSSSREAEYVHQILVENGIPLSNDVYHCLLVIYAHTGKPELCEELFNTMTTNNAIEENDDESLIGAPTTTTTTATLHQSMVNAYSIMGNFEKALHYATQVNMNVEILNTLLKSVATLCLPNMRTLYDEDYISSCLHKTLQLYVDHSIQYDGITLNILINIYGLLGKLQYMAKHFQMLVDSDFKEYVNPITFTTIIRHLCMNDQFDSALDMFNRMKELNIKPTGVTYKVLLEGMILGGKDCLPMIMQNMKYDNISMDDHLVGSIVLYYATRTRNEQQLMDILSVVDRHKSEYTPKVYEHLVLFYCKINNFVRAKSLVFEMLERGVTPTMRMFSHFITYLHTHMDAFDLLHILLPSEQDITNYINERKRGELNSLCNTIFEGRDLGIGLSLLQIILQKVDVSQLQAKIDHLSRDHHLNKNVCFILSGLIKTEPTGNVKEFIESLLHLFDSCGCVPFGSTNALFLFVIGELYGPNELKQSYLKMERNNLVIDIRGYNLYLDALLTTEGPGSMWKFFNTQTKNEMVKIHPDTDTLHILIRGVRDGSDMEKFILPKYKQFIDSTKYLPSKLSKMKASKNSPELKEEIVSSVLDTIEDKESIIFSQTTLLRMEEMKDYLKRASFSFIE